MALNPSGAISLAGPVAGQSIALELGLSPTAVISLNDTAVRTLAGVPSGAIIMPTNFWGKSSYQPTQKGIFWSGRTTPSSATATSTANLVSNTGVIAGDTATVGTSRSAASGAGYGGDKAVFAFGLAGTPTNQYTIASNFVSNTGVLAANTTISGIGRQATPSAQYGNGKAIFGFGRTSAAPSTNSYILMTDTGVFGTDTTSTGNVARNNAGATTYGKDKVIFAWGTVPGPSGAAGNTATLVSNTGTIGADFTCAGSGRRLIQQGATYGTDTAIFYCGFGPGPTGPFFNAYNLVSNTGVIASDSPGVGSARSYISGTGYGGDKAIFGYGFFPTGATNISNLVSNTGVVSADTPGVGTARYTTVGAPYSYT